MTNQTTVSAENLKIDTYYPGTGIFGGIVNRDGSPFAQLWIARERLHPVSYTEAFRKVADLKIDDGRATTPASTGLILPSLEILHDLYERRNEFKNPDHEFQTERNPHRDWDLGHIFLSSATTGHMVRCLDFTNGQEVLRFQGDPRMSARLIRLEPLAPA